MEQVQQPVDQQQAKPVHKRKWLLPVAALALLVLLGIPAYIAYLLLTPGVSYQGACMQVITRACFLGTPVCKSFSTPCSVPAGWKPERETEMLEESKWIDEEPLITPGPSVRPTLSPWPTSIPTPTKVVQDFIRKINNLESMYVTHHGGYSVIYPTRWKMADTGILKYNYSTKETKGYIEFENKEIVKRDTGGNPYITLDFEGNRVFGHLYVHSAESWKEDYLKQKGKLSESEFYNIAVSPWPTRSPFLPDGTPICGPGSQAEAASIIALDGTKKAIVRESHAECHYEGADPNEISRGYFILFPERQAIVTAIIEYDKKNGYPTNEITAFENVLRSFEFIK